ncbi:MAG: ribose ABC transporter permease [Nitrosarchaeum sp.]|nr:ribose ABC transporter permease [Nitrosarchaeum sp.]
MIKRKSLGQHFLKSHSIANLIASEAKITNSDTVLEIGTGFGMLTPLLCNKAKLVISIDSDENLYNTAKSNLQGIYNLVLKLGDGFKSTDKFDIFVSNLPYSKSKKAIEWLAQKDFYHGIIMVQKEFADKLFASGGERRAISIIANHTLEIQIISAVAKGNFNPPPKVDSVILKIIKKQTMSKQLIETVNKIFSYRRKTLQNIFKQFDKNTTIQKRLDDLSSEEIVQIAKDLTR